MGGKTRRFFSVREWTLKEDVNLGTVFHVDLIASCPAISLLGF
jgi:hypothetical protein